MNGQIPPLPLPVAAQAPTESKRLLHLLSALLASSLLHATLLYLPYLGERLSPSLLLIPASKANPHVFIATLTATVKPVTVSTSPAPLKGNQAELPRELPGTTDLKQQVAQENTAGIDLLPIPAPVYYTTDQLTKPPQPVVQAELDTPVIQPIIASGTIVIRIWIDEKGEVTNIMVEKSDLPELFSLSTIAAFKRMRFTPGERNGQHVGSMMRIEVNYEDGRAAGP